MKIRIITAFALAALLALSLTGCAATGAAADSRSGVTATQPAETTEAPAATAGTQPTAGESTITKEQAIAIALEHAGLTEADVTQLRAEYEIDDGVPEYDVEFRHGGWEYEYDIHAQTGEIRSFSRDD